MMNNRIKEAYRKAYDNYTEACDRYDNLVQAYRVLNGLTPVNIPGGEEAVRLPYTAKLMRQMRQKIAEAAIEKSVITDRARECARYLCVQ